jgi:hypothetical protein
MGFSNSIEKSTKEECELIYIMEECDAVGIPSIKTPEQERESKEDFEKWKQSGFKSFEDDYTSEEKEKIRIECVENILAACEVMTLGELSNTTLYLLDDIKLAHSLSIFKLIVLYYLLVISLYSLY